MPDLFSNVNFVLAVIAFFAGLLIGSFLNVCVFRMPRDLSVVSPRSFCPSCERMIPWYENIPVLSFFMLGGKCKGCKARIPWRYPFVELATGLLFAVWVGELGLSPVALKFCIYSAIMVALIATDIEERILPDEFTLGGTVVGLLLSVWVPLPAGLMSFFVPFTWGPRIASFAESAFSAAFASGAIWFVGWAYEKLRHREGMGFGDVKMIAMIGAFMGLPLALLTLIAGSLLGAIAGLAYIVITRKDAATYELPFGSFLGVAALIVALWGQVFSTWYSQLGH
jgi:leader peptidase (prepilin peptidase)/N-methyltransferase